MVDEHSAAPADCGAHSHGVTVARYHSRTQHTRLQTSCCHLSRHKTSIYNVLFIMCIYSILKLAKGETLGVRYLHKAAGFGEAGRCKNYEPLNVSIVFFDRNWKAFGRFRCDNIALHRLDMIEMLPSITHINKDILRRRDQIEYVNAAGKPPTSR
ncbi:uncharacterized protein F4812DRAFT_372634 [Daldinia caldariorum]|uniref:uncharacterized protein n=1 Tax=Daldinia caldariorum TaxID=326644 RepID=UPI00200836AA|nr:uncharacterized protein F4812DRAFT_372634 [Daldinia caldariorum]KAI1468540.1 hypothetical protein F4812DRAFT_372634 [Daldinia caldariorum]